MKKAFNVLARWSRNTRAYGFAIIPRDFSFSKYRIDARQPTRYIERRLRRKLRRIFRVVLN